MALFKPFMGRREDLDMVEKHAGYVYFCVDDGSFHLDFLDAEGNIQRQQINANEANKLVGYNIATELHSSDSELPTSKSILTELQKYSTIEYVDNLAADGSDVYVQDTEPTDAPDGAVWVDTANDPSYIPPTIPEITEADNGKVLMVVNGTLQLVSLNLSVDADGVLSV